MVLLYSLTLYVYEYISMNADSLSQKYPVFLEGIIVGLIMLVLPECYGRFMYIKPPSAPIDINEKCSLSTAKSTVKGMNTVLVTGLR